MKPIPEYTDYLISEDGKVFSKKSNRYLKVSLNSAGYLRFAISHMGETRFLLLHRVIARVYGNLTDLNSELEVDHRDSVRTNNRVDNLNVLSKIAHVDKTLSSRGMTRKTCICSSCGRRTRIGSCRKCTSKLSGLSYEDILGLLDTHGTWVNIGRHLDVSDTAIRKRFNKLKPL